MASSVYTNIYISIAINNVINIKNVIIIATNIAIKFISNINIF